MAASVRPVRSLAVLAIDAAHADVERTEHERSRERSRMQAYVLGARRRRPLAAGRLQGVRSGLGKPVRVGVAADRRHVRRARVLDREPSDRGHGDGRCLLHRRVRAYQRRGRVMGSRATHVGVGVALRRGRDEERARADGHGRRVHGKGDRVHSQSKPCNLQPRHSMPLGSVQPVSCTPREHAERRLPGDGTDLPRVSHQALARCPGRHESCSSFRTT